MIDAVSANSIYDVFYLRSIEAESRVNPWPGQSQQRNYPTTQSLTPADATETDQFISGGENKTANTGYSRFSTDNKTNTDNNNNTNNTNTGNTTGTTDTEEAGKTGKTQKTGAQNSGELSDEEQREVQKLKEIDRKVRQHEMAHLSAAQGIAVSGANYEYQRGPDGISYAVGGDVKIDVSKENDPQATIDKARRVAAAALAPSDPSPQDRQVASKARQMEAQARMELTKQQTEKAAGSSNNQENPGEANPGNANASPANDTKTGAAQNQQTHPGIRSYQQNQSFAPTAANTNTPSTGAAFSTAAQALFAPNYFRLDIAA